MDKNNKEVEQKDSILSAARASVNYFVYPPYREDQALLERSYMLISVELLMVIYTAFIAVISFFNDLSNHISYWLALAIAWGSTLIHICVLIFYKHFGRLLLCANVTIAFLTFLLALAMIIGGGPIASGFGMLICIPSMLAFCVYGFRFGIWWSCVSFATMCILLVLEAIQYPMPAFIVEQAYPGFSAGHLISSFFVICAIIGTYELNNTDLTKRLARRSQRYRHLATHDPLTGLANRALFSERLNDAFHHAQQYKQKFAVLVVDLNEFKPLNDNYGHETGDQTLVAIGERIRQGLREHDFIARIGGDEFMLISENISSENQVVGLVQKLHQLLEAPLNEIGLSDNVSASIGYAIFPDHSEDPNELICIADKHMYNSKNTSKQATLNID